MNDARSIAVWVTGAAAIACLGIAAQAQSGPSTPTTGAAAPAGVVIVSEKHFWRKYYTFFPPSLSAKAATQPMDAAARAAVFAKTHDLGLRTPPPPDGWTRPDFDDDAWVLRRGRELVCGDGRLMPAMDATSTHLRGGDPFVEQIGQVCQRTRFIVKDRRRVRKLSLSMTYRGGFVAYLNGKEVARAHLPAGKIGPATPADDYPLDAWFYADGKEKGKYLNAFDKDAPFGLRERTFGPLDLPSSSLRDGVNVLAVELHRSDYPAEVARKRYEAGWQRGWSPVGLGLLGLTADADAGGFDLTVGQSGLRVWPTDVTKCVSTKVCMDVNESHRPMRIVAVRNGAFAGRILVADDTPIEALTVQPGPLTGKEGKTIPASAVQIRYGTTNPLWPGGVDYLDCVVGPRMPADNGGYGHRFDMLLDAPPAGQTVVPVWVTVHVPKDAAPGDYKGEIAVSVKGAATVRQAVEVHVADWKLPDVKNFASVMNIYQSPETLALYYKVKPWSEEHWKLIDRSMQLLGRAGNVGLFLPLLAESQRGNADSYVWWIPRDGTPATASAPAGGTYKYDFTIFDRYLDTAMKYHDPDRLFFVCLVVWGFEGDGDKNPVKVTVVDPATGDRGAMALPPYAAPESRALWKPLLEACRDRLKARKLDEKVLIGMAWDQGPKPASVDLFAEILPGAGWLTESHMKQWAYGYGKQSPNPNSRSRWDKTIYEKQAPVKYNSIVWGGSIPDPKVKRWYGWQHGPERLTMNFNRPGVDCLVMMGFQPLWAYHMWMESTLACGDNIARNGNGNCGGDYWKIVDLANKEGRLPAGGSGEYWNGSGTLYGIYPASNVGRTGVGNNVTDLFAPGPDGAVTTERFENALENNQESEARVFVEKALLDKARPLPAELAAECQQLLDERTNVLRYWAIGAGAAAPYNWQDRNRRLFDLAAKVQAALAAAPASVSVRSSKP